MGRRDNGNENRVGKGGWIQKKREGKKREVKKRTPVFAIIRIISCKYIAIYNYKKHVKVHYIISILKYHSKLYRAGDIFILQMKKLQLREVELICSNSNDWLGTETGPKVRAFSHPTARSNSISPAFIAPVPIIAFPGRTNLNIWDCLNPKPILSR